MNLKLACSLDYKAYKHNDANTVTGHYSLDHTALLFLTLAKRFVFFYLILPVFFFFLTPTPVQTCIGSLRSFTSVLSIPFSDGRVGRYGTCRVLLFLSRCFSVVVVVLCVTETAG